MALSTPPMANLLNFLLRVIERREVVEDSFLVRDNDFLKYFDFEADDAYIDTISEYIEHAFSLPNIHVEFCSATALAISDPLVIDFVGNCLHRLIRTPATEDLYDWLLRGNSMYSPIIIMTNSMYLKPIIIMLFNKYRNVEGYSYILYRFLHWASLIVATFSTLKFNVDDINILDIPFGIEFYSVFFKTGSDSEIIRGYSQRDKRLYYFSQECPK